LVAAISIASRLWAQELPENWPIDARIPEINGRVVDAITGAPIANLDVTLRALSQTGAFYGSGIDVLRYENSRTSAAGRFGFSTSLAKLEGPLTEMAGYWLSVNVTFWPIAWMKAQSPYGDSKIDTTNDDLSWEVTRDPLFRSTVTRVFEFSMRGPRVNTKSYFPIAVQFVRPCRQDWNANCVRLAETEGVRIPLIPVLADPAACGRIGDEALREQCRQLNTYRSAFAHRDLKLCEQVDGGTGSKRCAELLRAYSKDPLLFNR